MINPRALAAWSAAGLVVALGTTDPAYRALVAAAALAVLVRLRLPGVSLRPLATVLAAGWVMAIVLNALLSHLGDDVLLELPGWLPGVGGPVTLEAAAFGAVAGLGLVAAALAVAPLSLCLESHDLLGALPASLAGTGAALSASLNLVPGVARGYRAIAEGQRFRGWRPAGPSSWGEVLVPTLVTAIEDSVQLAEAMVARAYGSGPRTRFAPPAWTASDRLLLLAAAGAAGGFLACRAAGLAADWHAYPALAAPALEPLPLALSALLLLPALRWPR